MAVDKRILVKRLVKLAGLARREPDAPNELVPLPEWADVGGRRFSFVDRRHRSRGYGVPPWPSDFVVRLGRLEDLSGSLLEDFADDAGLPQHRVAHWRTREQPNDEELRAMLEWAQSVPGGMTVLLTDCSNPWPIRA